MTGLRVLQEAELSAAIYDPRYRDVVVPGHSCEPPSDDWQRAQLEEPRLDDESHVAVLGRQQNVVLVGERPVVGLAHPAIQ